MIYTQNRPPVLKANLGSNISYTPQISIINADGAVASLTSSDMIQLNSTSMWYYRVADNMAIPATVQDFMYFISDDLGNVISEGEFSIADAGSDLTGAISQREIIAPSVIGIPGSVSETKAYVIRFLPLDASGQFVSGVTEIGVTPILGPNISIGFSKVGNSASNVTANMTLGTNEWIYTWNIGYSKPADIVLVTIQFKKGTKEYKATRMIELVKNKEFNPQRIGTGVVS